VGSSVPVGRWVLVAIAAMVALACVPSDVRAAGVTFGGLSNQERPIIVRVSPQRSRVSRIIWDWQAKCVAADGTPATPSDHRASDDTGAQRFAINSLGRWAGRYTSPAFLEPTTGITQTYSYKMNGRLLARGTRMAGTIRVTLTEHDATGALLRTCRTGPITFNLED
jgi:hypothetical protein